VYMLTQVDIQYAFRTCNVLIQLNLTIFKIKKSRQHEGSGAHRIKKKPNERFRVGTFQPVFRCRGRFGPEPLLLFNNRKILFLSENGLLSTKTTKTIILCHVVPYICKISRGYQNHHSCPEFRVIREKPILIFTHPRSFLALSWQEI